MTRDAKTAWDKTSRRLSTRFCDLAVRVALFALAIAALGALASCGGGAVGIAVHDPRAEPLPLGPEGLPAPVVDACERWEIDCEPADGPLVVWLLPDANVEGLVELGRGMAASRCMNAFVAADLSMAHELGHALGLGHVHDAGNTMGDVGDPYLRLDVTDGQLEAAADRAEQLAGCP